jgi:superfamily II DNA or RNA helicase
MNKIKGDNYEIQIKDYIINELNKPAYLWHQTPETILINCGIIGSHNEHRLRRIQNKENSLIDTGIDIIQIEDNQNCSLVQCKNGYKKGLTMNDLAGFMCWIASLDKLIGYVYYTSKLSENIKSLPTNKRIIYVKKEYIESIPIIEDNKINPYDYQSEAQKEFNNKFVDRGIISMPCGTGKTLISYLCSNKHKQVIFISPLRQFAKQNLDKFIEYGYTNNTLLIDSDGERDTKQIKKFIKSNESFLFSSTFCSIDVIYKSLKYMKDPLFIIDEFHNLSKNNVTDENDDFYKLLHGDSKILFVSATPRIYELEDEDYELDLFGPTIYSMSFTEAFDKKYITDYKIWLPSIHEDNQQLDEVLSIYQIDSTIKAKCKYLYQCLLNNGSRKCIIYCLDIEEINSMINGINMLNDFYYLDYDINQITSKDNGKTRTKILNDFANNNKIQLLFSVRILDECIDIPSCDSIYITYPSQSKIRTIQRLSRCIRLDKTNKFKIGNIIIWCNEYDDILETLSGIKEYDLFFKDKIMINQTNFFGDSIGDTFTDDVKLIKNYLVGIKEFKQLSWSDKLKQVEDYIIANDQRPSTIDKNTDIKQLGEWIGHQQKNYKKNEQIMKDERRKSWSEFIEKYKKYFLSYNEIWYNKLKLVEDYIIANDQRPSAIDKNTDIKQLGTWIGDQKQNYKKNDHIMKDETIRKSWTEFIEKYKKYFLSNNEIWYNNLKLVEDYIIANDKRPSSIDKNTDIKQLGVWIGHQQKNYKNNKHIMKDESIRNLWEHFIEKYKKYFLSNDEEWYNNLKLVEDYIISNNKRPLSHDENIDIKKLGTWISNQQKNYKTNKDIMKDESIRKSWSEFTEKYKKYFLSYNEIWYDNLKLVEDYIIINNKRPSKTDKNNDIKQLGSWISNQLNNYKNNEYSMSDETIRKSWKQFIEKYKKYFN